MSTQQIALACVLSAFILISCNSNKSKLIIADIKEASVLYDTIHTIKDELLDISQYNSGFNKIATQRFTVSAKKISIVTASGGLKITINPTVLEKEDGSQVDGKIKVSIIELTNSSDLFKSNAATVSNSRLLASGGSYFIGMECNGQKLRIRNGKTLQVDLPLLANDEMELFYGERNADNNLNWERAGMNLKPVEDDIFQVSDNNMVDDDFPVQSVSIVNQLRLYKTLDEKVYYYDKIMTLREIVDTINRYKQKVYIDTAYAWPKELENLPKGTRVDTNYLYTVYGPRHQFFLKTVRGQQEEKERMARQEAIRDSMLKQWEPKSLSGQILKYYQPTAIRALGWINCDRFYRFREQTDVDLELPITFNNSRIQFFLLFKSFNGLLNLNMDTSGVKRNVLRSLPLGEPVTLIGFVKNNGQIFHCKIEFIIQKNRSVQPEFKNISTEEITKMFGKNIRI